MNIFKRQGLGQGKGRSDSGDGVEIRSPSPARKSHGSSGEDTGSRGSPEYKRGKKHGGGENHNHGHENGGQGGGTMIRRGSKKQIGVEGLEDGDFSGTGGGARLRGVSGSNFSDRNPTNPHMIPTTLTLSLHAELNRKWTQYPSLKDTPEEGREELFRKKLKQCEMLVSFTPLTDKDSSLQAVRKNSQTLKRAALLDLVEYVNTPSGQKIFTESMMGPLVQMVEVNISRSLPFCKPDFDVEEDEPTLDLAWPHLQVVYELFLRFVVSSEVNAKDAKKYITAKLCLTLINLFDSEDPRERDYLKTILHRIYGKFMSHRSYIRKAINNVFYTFIYESEYHNGIGELLEILGSIINGFAIPLKAEHTTFLQKALLPLHKHVGFSAYQQQLSFCLIQFVEKDPDTASFIIKKLIELWPWCNSQKQVLYINELEELLELLGFDQLLTVKSLLFTHLGKLVGSSHFQVSERALCLWNNSHLVNSGCLSRQLAADLLPVIFAPLFFKSDNHWNSIVEGLAKSVQKLYQEFDPALYDQVAAEQSKAGVKFRGHQGVEEKILQAWEDVEKST